MLEKPKIIYGKYFNKNNITSDIIIQKFEEIKRNGNYNRNERESDHKIILNRFSETIEDILINDENFSKFSNNEIVNGISGDLYYKGLLTEVKHCNKDLMFHNKKYTLKTLLRILKESNLSILVAIVYSSDIVDFLKKSTIENIEDFYENRKSEIYPLTIENIKDFFNGDFYLEVYIKEDIKKYVEDMLDIPKTSIHVCEFLMGLKDTQEKKYYKDIINYNWPEYYEEKIKHIKGI